MIPLGEGYYGDSPSDKGEYVFWNYKKGPYMPSGLAYNEYLSNPAADDYFENVTFTGTGWQALWVGLQASQIVVEERMKVKEIGLGAGRRWGGTMSIPYTVLKAPSRVHFALYTDKGGKPDKLVHVFGMVYTHPDSLFTTEFEPSKWSSNPMWFSGVLRYDYEIEAGVYWLAWYGGGNTFMVNGSADIQSYDFWIGDPEYEYTDVAGHPFPHTAVSRYSSLGGIIYKDPVPYNAGRIMAYIKGDKFKEVDEYKSELTISNMPLEVMAGEQFSFDVMATNIGGAVWDGNYSFGLDVNSEPEDETVWGVNRVSLPSSMGYKDVENFTVTLTAPLDHGNYTLSARMVQDHVDGAVWFGELYTTNIVIKPDPESWIKWLKAPSYEWFMLTLDGNKLTVDVSFPSGCYRMADWGEVVEMNNSVYTVDLSIEKWGGSCTQSIQKVSHTYTLEGSPDNSTLMMYNNGISFGTAVLRQVDPVDPTPTSLDPVIMVWEPYIDFGGYTFPALWLVYFGLFFLGLAVVTRNDTRFYRDFYLSKR